MSTIKRPRFHARLLLSDARLRHRVEQCLASISVGYTPGGDPPEWTILDCDAAESMDSLPDHAILLCTGRPVGDRLVADIAARGGTFLDVDKLTPFEMLRSLFSTEAKRESLRRHLLDAINHVEEAMGLVDVFLEDPARTHSVTDGARRLGMSVGGLRQLYPELKVERWEHLQARLRAEAWIHLFEWGVPGACSIDTWESQTAPTSARRVGRPGSSRRGRGSRTPVFIYPNFGSYVPNKVTPNATYLPLPGGSASDIFVACWYVHRTSTRCVVA